MLGGAAFLEDVAVRRGLPVRIWPDRGSSTAVCSLKKCKRVKVAANDLFSLRAQPVYRLYK